MFDWITIWSLRNRLLTVTAFVIALIVAGIVTGLVAWFSRYPQIGVGLGVVLFIALLLSGIGTPRSLRLTSLLSAWLLYLLINMLRLTNPRPGNGATWASAGLRAIRIMRLSGRVMWRSHRCN